VTTSSGKSRKGAEHIVKQLTGIRWWIDAYSKPPHPLLRAVIVLNRRRGAPPSYMGIKRVLVEEFGEDAVNVCRKEVQALLEKRHVEWGKELAGKDGE
jgi:hypothetical protein